MIRDLGFESPELGYVGLAELTALRGSLGLLMERDTRFVAGKPLSTYPKMLALTARF